MWVRNTKRRIVGRIAAGALRGLRACNAKATPGQVWFWLFLANFTVLGYFGCFGLFWLFWAILAVFGYFGCFGLFWPFLAILPILDYFGCFGLVWPI